ncbi:hypothetical protein OIO90_000501 [Microbotryomycetes sp. JL221]|nr:hypothetical protein OIO90_000501 [Microbotryomycetes sp. JL221]
MAEELMHEVSTGKAHIDFTRPGFYNLLQVRLSSGVAIQFSLDSMESMGAACLSAHLIVPLLGVSSALLGLLKDLVKAKDSLRQQVEDAVDASATVERSTGGRACKVFFGAGGGSVMRRWSERKQRGPGRELAIAPTDHISFSSGSLGAQSQPHKPPTPKTKRSPEKERNVSPPSSATPSASCLSPYKSIAHQMLNHKSQQLAGEAVGWDDSQTFDSLPRSSRVTDMSNSRSLVHGKNVAENYVGMATDEDGFAAQESQNLLPPATQVPSKRMSSPMSLDSSMAPSSAINRGRDLATPPGLPISSGPQNSDDADDHNLSAEEEPATDVDRSSEIEDEELAHQRRKLEEERAKAAKQAAEKKARLQTLMRAKEGMAKRSAAMAAGRTAAKKQKRL